MLYYGVILFTMRKITKVEDAVMIPNKPYYDKNIGRTNSIIKWDRFLLFFHLIAFILLIVAILAYYTIINIINYVICITLVHLKV